MKITKKENLHCDNCNGYKKGLIFDDFTNEKEIYVCIDCILEKINEYETKL